MSCSNRILPLASVSELEWTFKLWNCFIIWVQPCTVNIENIVSQFELPKDTQGNFEAKCRHCPPFISVGLKITSNFNTYIKVSKNMINFNKLLCTHLSAIYVLL